MSDAPAPLGIKDIMEGIFGQILAQHRAETGAQHAEIMARRKQRRDKETAARRAKKSKRPLAKKRVLVGVKKVKRGDVLEQEFRQ